MEIRTAFGAARRRGPALAAAVLALGLGAGAAGSLALAAEDARAAALALRTASVRGALDPAFHRYADTVHDLAAAAGGRTPRLPADMSRSAGERLPGAHQILVVDAGGMIRSRHTADASTPPGRPRLDPDPELARTLDLARATGRVVASPARVPAADRDLPPALREPEFELAAPVTDGDTFRGWVVLGVRVPDLLREALRDAGVTGVTVELIETSPAGTREVTRWAGDGDPDGTEHGIVDLALGGHIWRAVVRPTTALIGAGRAAAAPLALLGAVLTSLLLAGISRTGRHGPGDSGGGQTGTHRPDDPGDGTGAGLRRPAQSDAGDAELSRFATHLQAPLHTVTGCAELLREHAPRLDDAARGLLDRIDRGTARMAALVDELVAYSAAADVALRPEPVDAGRVALRVVAGRLDHVTAEPPSIDVGDLPPVTADAELLGEVLGRLVDNAVRFVRRGTAAQVTIRAHEHAPGWWRIEVADRGIGVPDEQRTRVFAPFHRAPAAEVYPGAGLGLAVCRRIVARHGGEIGVATNPGGGSVFWFTVPGTDVTPATGPELMAADLA